MLWWKRRQCKREANCANLQPDLVPRRLKDPLTLTHWSSLTRYPAIWGSCTAEAWPQAPKRLKHHPRSHIIPRSTTTFTMDLIVKQQLKHCMFFQMSSLWAIAFLFAASKARTRTSDQVSSELPDLQAGGGGSQEANRTAPMTGLFQVLPPEISNTSYIMAYGSLKGKCATWVTACHSSVFVLSHQLSQDRRRP